MEFGFRILLTLFSIVYLGVFFYHLKDAILLLVPMIKCRKISGCKKDDCPFRRGCRRIAFSDKEIAEMKKYIDSMK